MKRTAQGVNEHSRPARFVWSPSESGNLFPLKSLGFSRSWEPHCLSSRRELWEWVSRGKVPLADIHKITEDEENRGRTAAELFCRPERLLPNQIGPLVPGTNCLTLSCSLWEWFPGSSGIVRSHVRKYARHASPATRPRHSCHVPSVIVLSNIESYEVQRTRSRDDRTSTKQMGIGWC